MKRQAFTLIELLSVIILLAIILVIAVPRILKVIEGTKISAYKQNEEMIVKATKLYSSLNLDSLPQTIGETTEINLNNLITSGYIKTVKDPDNRNQNCNGYVLVTKVNNEEYDYIPHVKCGSENTITNSNDDALVTHYNFNDFQEPTQNLYPGPTTQGMHFPSAFNGNYGFGVGTNSKWEIDNSDRPFPNSDVQKISRINSGVNQRLYVEWSEIIFKSASVNFALNEEKTISFYYYGTFGTSLTPYIGGQTGDILLYADNAISGNGTTNIVLPVKVNEWTRVTFRIKNVGVTPAVFNWAWMILHSNAVDSILDNTHFWKFTGVQVENKKYVTPYVTGTRDGTIKDYSIKNNAVTLQLATTPKWVEKGRNGTGVYEFNGTSSYINAGNSADVNLTNVGSIVLWAKSNRSYPSDSASSDFRGLISKTSGGGGGEQSYYIDWYGTNTTRIIRAGIGDNIGSNVITVSNYELYNEWKQIGMTWNGSHLILYSNGKEIGRTVQNRNAFIILNPLEIGRAFNGCYWSGSIDDVQIYKRALPAEEIMMMYNMSK